MKNCVAHISALLMYCIGSNICITGCFSGAKDRGRLIPYDVVSSAVYIMCTLFYFYIPYTQP